MKTIVYTGPIADFYQFKLKHLLMTHGFDLMKSRVEGKGSRPVIVIHLEAKLAWIEYVSEEISEYNNDNTLFTCSIEDIEEEINLFLK